MVRGRHRKVGQVWSFCARMLWAALLALAFVTLPDSASADDGRIPINVATLQTAAEVAQHGSYYIQPDSTYFDFDQRLSLPELVALAREGAFVPIATRRVGFGVQASIVHVRIPLINPSGEARKVVLAFHMAAYGATTVNLVLDDAPLPDQPLLSEEERQNWNDRDVLLHQDIEMPARSGGAVYVTFGNKNSSSPMTVETIDHYEERRTSEEITFHIILALIVGVALVTVTLMTALGHPSAFAYAAYLLLMCVYLYGFEEHLYQGFLRPIRLYGPKIDLFTSFFAIFFYLLYLRQFLSTVPGSLRQEKTLFYVGYWILLISFVSPFLERPYLLINDITAAVLLPLNVYMGVVAIMKRQRGGWPFFAGVLVLTLILVFRAFGGSYFSAHIAHIEVSRILHMAVLFEAVAFALAMLLQVRGVRIERHAALLAQVDATREKLEMSKTLAGAAHDMRQPLAALNVAIADGAKGKRGSDSLRSAVQYLDDIVSTTLADAERRHAAEQPPPAAPFGRDLSHGAEESPPPDETYAVQKLFHHLQEMLGHEAQAKGLDLRFVDCRAQVHANPLALMRILANLTSNAIQNTQNGKVLVGCRRQGYRIKICVCDTGPGMSAAELDRLTQPFQREGDYKGSGLGLSIVKELCDEHGYVLDVNSQVNCGTSACVTVPRMME